MESPTLGDALEVVVWANPRLEGGVVSSTPTLHFKYSPDDARRVGDHWRVLLRPPLRDAPAPVGCRVDTASLLDGAVDADGDELLIHRRLSQSVLGDQLIGMRTAVLFVVVPSSDVRQSWVGLDQRGFDLE